MGTGFTRPRAAIAARSWRPRRRSCRPPRPWRARRLPDRAELCARIGARGVPGLPIVGGGMSRLPAVNRDALAPEDQVVWDRIAGVRGGVQGPFGVLIHVPALADRM